MKLRTQSSIVILPLLLGAVVIMGISRYLSERNEMMWGAQGEIEAFAVSLAESINPVYLERLGGKEAEDAETVSHLLTPLQRVYESGLLRSLAIYGRDGEQLLYVRGVWTAVDMEKISEEDLQAVRALLSHDRSDAGEMERAVVRRLRHQSEDRLIPVLRALAPVSDGSGAMVAVVAVETDVSHIAERSHGVIAHVAKTGLSIALLGVVAIQMLSTFIGRPVRILTEAFRAAVEGGDRRWLGFLRIQEFQELGDAYNTMISVLDEADSRFSRNLMQQERHRTREGLRAKYAAEFQAPVRVSSGAFIACGRIIGPAGRDFLDVQCTPQKLLGVTGSLKGTDESNLFLGVSTVSTLIRSYLDGDGDANVYEILAGFYEIDFFHCVEIDLTTGRFQIWLQGLGLDQLTTWEGTLAAGESIVLHTFAGEAAHRIGIYQRHLLTMPPDQLMEQFLGALGGDYKGAIAVVKCDAADGTVTDARA